MNEAHKMRKTNMNRHISIIFAAMLLAPAGAQAAESGADKNGFVPLFDGKTLNCATTIKAGRRRQLKLPSWEGGFLG
jgi:hypothetical protein